MPRRGSAPSYGKVRAGRQQHPRLKERARLGHRDRPQPSHRPRHRPALPGHRRGVLPRGWTAPCSSSRETPRPPRPAARRGAAEGRRRSPARPAAPRRSCGLHAARPPPHRHCPPPAALPGSPPAPPPLCSPCCPSRRAEGCAPHLRAGTYVPGQLCATAIAPLQSEHARRPPHRGKPAVPPGSARRSARPSLPPPRRQPAARPRSPTQVVEGAEHRLQPAARLPRPHGCRGPAGRRTFDPERLPSLPRWRRPSRGPPALRRARCSALGRQAGAVRGHGRRGRRLRACGHRGGVGRASAARGGAAELAGPWQRRRRQRRPGGRGEGRPCTR